MRFDAGVANERERVARRPALGIVIDNDVGGHAPVSRSPVAPSMPPISFNLRAIAISSMLSYGSARKRSEEHTSELQSLMRISYAVFCLTKNKHNTTHHY